MNRIAVAHTLDQIDAAFHRGDRVQAARILSRHLASRGILPRLNLVFTLIHTRLQSPLHLHNALIALDRPPTQPLP